MLELIRWLIDHDWDFHYIGGTLSFIVTNYEKEVCNDEEAKRALALLKADKNYANEVDYSDEVKEFAEEKVKPLVDELVQLVFEDGDSVCQVEDCNKPDSISCHSRLCVEENKRIWHQKVDALVKEFRS